MKTIRDTLRRVQLPDTINLITGGEEEAYIRDETEKFFSRIRGALGMQATKWDAWFDVYVRTLTSPYHDGLSNDKLTGLRFDGGILAGCLDERDESNYHSASFFIVQPTERIERAYKSLWQSDSGDSLMV